MIIGTLALVGVFVSTYLTLYKLGYIGTLNCAIGSCETVNTSRWATFFGMPVAAWGLGFYLVALTVAFMSVQERYADSRKMAVALAVLTGWGTVFSGWLTYRAVRHPRDLHLVRDECVHRARDVSREPRGPSGIFRGSGLTTLSR